MKKINGITLVALVITIIILLILAGITISTLNGENGLLSRVKQAKDNYSISEAKEKIEMAIADLRIEEEKKGESLTKEKLPKMNNDEIDVRNIDNFPVEVICNNYKFNIDSNFNVTYVGKTEETVITYTTEPEGYTNKDKIKILIKIKNSKGIKSISTPSENDRIIAKGQTEVGIDYEVTANGKYTFKVIDNEEKEVTKEIIIDSIDKVEPKDFTPVAKNITLEGFTISVNVEDGDATENSTKSGIEKYEYYVKESSETTYNKYENSENEYKITGLKAGTKYNVYVIAYDKASNSKKSSSIEVTTYTKPYPPLAKISFNEANATEKVAEYPILKLDGVKNCVLEPNIGENITLEITSKETENLKYYYSIDGGNTWNEYKGIVNTTYKADELIQVKSIYRKNELEIESQSKSVKKYLYDKTKDCSNSTALNKVAYDNDFTTYSNCDVRAGEIKNKLLVDSECWGKNITLYAYEPIDGYGTIGFYSSMSVNDSISSGYLYKFCGEDVRNKTVKSIEIPEDTKMVLLADGTDNKYVFYVYEVICTEENLTGKAF